MEAEQDKNRIAHWVPLHQEIIKNLKLLLNEDTSEKPLSWKRCNIYLRKNVHVSISSRHPFTLSDTRKFFEQESDRLKMDERILRYITTHGITGVDWKHYKAFSRDTILKEYKRVWDKVKL
jgi:uracil DNA glycosylase